MTDSRMMVRSPNATFQPIFDARKGASAHALQAHAWDHNTFLRVVRVRPSSRACFCMLLVLLAARAGGEGQGESDDQARWAREHFVQHAWIFNVHSLHNYTKQCCLFSGQLLTHLGGAVIAKRLSRGWVEPHFIHQQRNSSLAESQIDAGTATLEQDSHILGQILVECSRVFRCNRSVFAPYNDKYLSLEQLHTHSDGVIDHLLVQSAEVISRQACIDARNCSSRSCPMVAVDAGGPRHMEFYGRRFFVKRVSCFPGDTGFFHSHVMPGTERESSERKSSERESSERGRAREREREREGGERGRGGRERKTERLLVYLFLYLPGPTLKSLVCLYVAL